MLHKHLQALVTTVIAVALLAACGDAHPTGTNGSGVAVRPGAPPLRSTVEPFLMTEQDAFEIADPYYVRDVLAPLGGNYDAFFNDPEVISDAQFKAQGPYSVGSGEEDAIEADATAVNNYCEFTTNGGGGGAPDPFYSTTSGETTVASWSSCEQKWIRCWDRCRRLPAFPKQAKALCWAGCAASYALCVRRRRGG